MPLPVWRHQPFAPVAPRFGALVAEPATPAEAPPHGDGGAIVEGAAVHLPEFTEQQISNLVHAPCYHFVFIVELRCYLVTY